MNNAMVNSPEELKKFGSDLNKLSQDLGDNMQNLLRQLTQLHDTFKDKQYDRMEPIIKSKADRIKYLSEEMIQYGNHLIGLGEDAQAFLDASGLTE